MSAGTHCPSCRCLRVGGAGVHNSQSEIAIQQGMTASHDRIEPIIKELLPSPHQSYTPIQNQNLMSHERFQPISEHVVSSTTHDECKSNDRVIFPDDNLPIGNYRTSNTPLTPGRLNTWNFSEAMESEHLKQLDEDATNETKEHNYLTFDREEQSEIVASPRYLPSVLEGQILGNVDDQDFILIRRRCNTDPGRLLLSPQTPDTCIAMAQSAFGQLASGETSGEDMGRLAVPRRGANRETRDSAATQPAVVLGSVKMSLDNVCNVMRNFPGWSPRVDEKSVRTFIIIWYSDFSQVIKYLSCMLQFISAPEPKAQVHYCDHALSVVRRPSVRRPSVVRPSLTFKFSTSSLKPLNGI